MQHRSELHSGATQRSNSSKATTVLFWLIVMLSLRASVHPGLDRLISVGIRCPSCGLDKKNTNARIEQNRVGENLCTVSKHSSIRAQVVSPRSAADQYKHISLCGL